MQNELSSKTFQVNSKLFYCQSKHKLRRPITVSFAAVINYLVAL